MYKRQDYSNQHNINPEDYIDNSEDIVTPPSNNDSSDDKKNESTDGNTGGSTGGNTGGSTCLLYTSHILVLHLNRRPLQLY